MPKRNERQLPELIVKVRDLITWGIPVIIAIIAATYAITIQANSVKPPLGPKTSIPVDTTVSDTLIQPSVPDSILILIGSGTVVRFLKSLFPELNTASNPLVFSGPSLSAFQLLIHKEHEGVPNFGCIALSATHIESDSIIDDAIWAGFQRGNKNKRVVALKIANDDLKAGLLMPESEPFRRYKNQIRDSDLYHLAMQCGSSGYDVYSTSEQSGTLTEFRKIFKRVDSTFNDIPACISFFDTSPWSIHKIMRKKKPALFLCSTIYSSEPMKLLSIYDANGNILRKPLYLYFIVRTLNSDNTYTVSGASARFLIKLKTGSPDLQSPTVPSPSRHNTMKTSSN